MVQMTRYFTWLHCFRITSKSKITPQRCLILKPKRSTRIRMSQEYQASQIPFLDTEEMDIDKPTSPRIHKITAWSPKSSGQLAQQQQVEIRILDLLVIGKTWNPLESRTIPDNSQQYHSPPALLKLGTPPGSTPLTWKLLRRPLRRDACDSFSVSRSIYGASCFVRRIHESTKRIRGRLQGTCLNHFWIPLSFSEPFLPFPSNIEI